MQVYCLYMSLEPKQTAIVKHLIVRSLATGVRNEKYIKWIHTKCGIMARCCFRKAIKQFEMHQSFILTDYDRTELSLTEFIV